MMKNSEPVFDKYAKQYDEEIQEAISASGYSVNHFYEYKIKEIHRILRSPPIHILDFGCGVGNVDPYIRKYFPEAEIYGVDISPESINIAKEKQKEFNISYSVFDPDLKSKFPFEKLFDMIFISGVIHHIPPSEHKKTLSFIESLMNQNGILFIFEHNPYNPVTRIVFRKWDLKVDKNANMIRPSYLKKQLKHCNLKCKKRNFTVFFPKILAFLNPLEKFMTAIPLGAQYYIIAKKNMGN
jgi:SAM-dependent methyltransferase